MSGLDELLERSRAPGAFVERRHFTLSREKAIEKQREFALRDARQYVLEIIQGAIFAGATYMAVDARKNSILIAWVGAPPLEKRHLENLFDYLFADRSDKRIRHMVQLAVGINAILQRKPKSIRLESGDGKKTVRLDMDAGGEGDIGLSENPIDGTYLVAEWSSGLLGGLFGRFSNTQHLDVGKLIEDKCLYTPVPILLNGNAPFGFRATRNIEIFGARAQEQFDDGDRRGVIALHTSPHAPRGFRMVVGGVWITQAPLEQLSPEPLVGVICDDNLRKTADHSDIVQDVRFTQMLHKVQPHATRLLKRVNERYVPPTLPPVPAEVAEERSEDEGPKIEYEPLPEVLLLVGPRGHTTVERLQDLDGEPLFWCTPEVSKDLGEAADPLRFPFRVLRLKEGEANTLGRELPHAQLHRLNGPSDIDFVLRVMERGNEIREITVPLPVGSLTIRLHVSGRLPAWGNGRPGVPFLVRYDGKTQATGSVDDTHVWTQGMSDRPATYEIGVPMYMPGVSLIVETAAGGATLDDEVARRALDAAWKLAAPEDDEPDARLLAALLATQSLPQFREDPHPVGRTRHPDATVCLEASLPHSWPVRLRKVPLVDTHLGPLDLDGFLGLLQSGEVAWIKDPEGYARMEPLEKRFGYGHLAPYGVDSNPLFAVARIGHRWVWISDRTTYRDAHFTHLVYVARHKAPRTEDAHWETDEQPFPELVAIRRREADRLDLAEAWQELYDGLRRTEADNTWDQYAFDASIERVRGLGRVALLHLANVVPGGLQHALLLPSDGGARWSIERLRNEANARVAAANGVVVAEPRTFAVTLAEYQAISPDHGTRLRYDDHPDVWRSLAETSDEGWLLRTEITEARLRGWLGLRLPYDATCGILLRTTGQLIGLPELDERIPCHGLLWPLHGGHRLSTDERQLVQLTGLRMYAQLVDTLKQRLPDDTKRSAQLYAWSFCWRAHQRGRLTGTALQLARQVEVFGDDGRTWGTLDRWLDTAPARRPQPPPDVVLPPPPEEEVGAEPQEEVPSLQGILDRLNAALPRNVEAQAHAGQMGRAAPVTLDTGAGSRSRIVLALNTDHAIVKDGLEAAGPAQELLLLEMARQCALWGQGRGHQLDLLRLQQVLLSQRFED
ncbi:MAG: hypothetical protein H6737_02310 [Alphaproteobacteria bacterium]|nr:hypothetical protein [Alphaproteobacteria bacterium]